jgi:hypothetical protein
MRYARFASVVSLLSLAVVVWGQATTATISGVVVDAAGAVVVGAHVRVKNVETGVEKVAETTSAGRYTVSGLVPGTYEVSVEAPGFKTALQRVKLAVGDHVTLDVRLEVGEVVERVTISGEAARVELERATLSGLIDDKQIRELPLNARSYVHLSFLHTGVMAFTHVDTATVATRGPQMVVSGLRPSSNAYLLDGVYVNDAGGRTIGSAAGVALGVDAVREFRVLTNSYSAEFGMASGGVVTAVTRSGTNEFHGSAFWFHRNDNLDARNFFDRRKPEFRRHQFGFTAEGPVRRDRTFFFGIGEWFRELKGFTRIIRVPSLAARRGEIVPVAESVRPYVELFPLPNGPDLGGGLAEYRFPQDEVVNETFFQIRMDHVVSRGHTLFGRYTFDDATAVRATATPNPLSMLDQLSRNQYVVLQWDGVVSASLLNTLRGGFTRTNISVTTRFLRPIDHSALAFVPGRVLGTLVIGGIGAYGWDPRTPAISLRNAYMLTDDLALTRGAHSVKVGVSLHRFQDNVGVFGWPNGNYDFPSVREFLQGRAERLIVMAAGSVGDRAWRQWVIGSYVQDDWRVRPRLTVNLGIRYEVTTVLKEAHERVSNLRDVLRDAEMTLGDPIMENPSLRNVAPRLGFAYDLLGDGKMALRGGFGLFFDPVLYFHFYPGFILAPPFQQIGAIRAPLFPRHPIPDRFPNRTQNIQIGAFRAENPHSLQWNLNLQREVVKEIVVTVGYAGSRGINLMRGGEVNTPIPQVREGRKFFPAGLARRNPNWGGIDLKRGDGNSWYNALQVSAEKRFSKGYSLQVAYTFSRTIDEGSAQISQDVLTSTPDPQDPDDRRNERGLSAFHVKHNVAVNGLVELPFWRDQVGVVGKVLGGWQVSGIFTARSGLPFTPAVSADRARALLRRPATVRPDIKAGASVEGAILGNEGFKRTGRFYDPSIFQLQPVGYLGNAGRNILIGPNLVSLDVALMKNIRLWERGMLQFRMEFYNALNRANFAPPDRIIFAGTGAEESPLPSAGRITSTATDNRQIQVAVKVVF